MKFIDPVLALFLACATAREHPPTAEDLVRIETAHIRLLAENQYAQQLRNQGRDDLVRLVAEAMTTRSRTARKGLLISTGALLRQRPFPSSTYCQLYMVTRALDDYRFTKSFGEVFNRAISDPDPKYDDIIERFDAQE